MAHSSPLDINIIIDRQMSIKNLVLRRRLIANKFKKNTMRTRGASRTCACAKLNFGEDGIVIAHKKIDLQ